MATPKITIECSDLDAFRYTIKELPKILKQRFIEAGGDPSTARYRHNGNRYEMTGELNSCFDLSEMD